MCASQKFGLGSAWEAKASFFRSLRCSALPLALSAKYVGVAGATETHLAALNLHRRTARFRQRIVICFTGGSTDSLRLFSLSREFEMPIYSALADSPPGRIMRSRH